MMLRACVSELWLWGAPIALVVTAYSAMDWLLLKHPRYANLDNRAPEDPPGPTQLYIASNLIKAGTLMMFSVPLVSMVYPLLARGEINIGMLRTLAPVYAALDIVSLVKVPRMKKSTIFHHYAVAATAALIRYDQHIVLGSLPGALCVYGLFSMLAYFVNGFLALRYLVSPESREFIARAAWLSGVGYALICAIHWPYQLHTAYTHQIWALPVVVAAFVTDDIDLMRYLFRFSLEKTVVLVSPNCFRLGMRDNFYQALTHELGEPVAQRRLTAPSEIRACLEQHYGADHLELGLHHASMGHGPVEAWCFEGVSAVRRVQKISKSLHEDYDHNMTHVSRSVDAGKHEASNAVGWFTLVEASPSAPSAGCTRPPPSAIEA